MSYLSVAPDPDDEPVAPLPAFQGKPVSASSLKAARVNFELDDVFDVDDIVEVTLELRISGVAFDVNERSGDLERRHNARVLDVTKVRRIAGPNSTEW